MQVNEKDKKFWLRLKDTIGVLASSRFTHKIGAKRRGPVMTGKKTAYGGKPAVFK